MVRKRVVRWADSESITPTSSFVARRTSKVIKMMPGINLLTYLDEVYT